MVLFLADSLSNITQKIPIQNWEALLCFEGCLIVHYTDGPVCHWWSFRLFLVFYWGHCSKYLWKYLCLCISLSWFLRCVTFWCCKKSARRKQTKGTHAEIQGLLPACAHLRGLLQLLLECCGSCFSYYFELLCLKLLLRPFPWVPSERLVVAACQDWFIWHTCLTFDRLFIRTLTSVWSCLAWPGLGTPRWRDLRRSGIQIVKCGYTGPHQLWDPESISLPKWNTKRMGSISFDFRTTEPNGLILFTRQAPREEGCSEPEEHQRWTSLLWRLLDGNLYLLLDMGSGTIKVKATQRKPTMGNGTTWIFSETADQVGRGRVYANFPFLIGFFSVCTCWFFCYSP